ncbi:MAG: type II toxin-antitoxin system VapC family toxin [Methylobacter tundripaludum]|nr:type II toxin-antitoxin system VapC family toxin [Methylobacter tundripaludum]
MRVVDTSIWIEWLINSSLNQTIAESFPETTECIVPTIVQLELSKWLTREVGEAEADQVIAYTQNCVVATLDTKTALQAAELHRQYKLATADAIVYATALAYDADLITCDAHFEGLPNVVFIRKA